MHNAIRELDAGDELNVRPANGAWELTTTEGRPVGRLAQAYPDFRNSTGLKRFSP